MAKQGRKMGDIICFGRSYWDEGYYRIRYDQKVSPKGVNYWDRAWIGYIWVWNREKHLLANEMLVTYKLIEEIWRFWTWNKKAVSFDIHQLFSRANLPFWVAV